MSERKPNFKRDYEVYGKFGEDDFIEFYSKKGFNIKDVSNNVLYQLSDVDFLISKCDIDVKDDKDLLFSRDVKNRKIYKCEVKTDTVSYKSRNVIYEVISHDFAGCMAETKSDFIYYVFVQDVNGDGSNLVKKEAWTINVTKWREFLREKFFSGKFTKKELDETYGIWVNNLNDKNKPEKEQEKIANIVCDIDKLQENGIAKRQY